MLHVINISIKVKLQVITGSYFNNPSDISSLRYNN